MKLFNFLFFLLASAVAGKVALPAEEMDAEQVCYARVEYFRVVFDHTLPDLF